MHDVARATTAKINTVQVTEREMIDSPVCSWVQSSLRSLWWCLDEPAGGWKACLYIICISVRTWRLCLVFVCPVRICSPLLCSNTRGLQQRCVDFLYRVNKQQTTSMSPPICLFQPSVSCVRGAKSTCHLNLLLWWHFLTLASAICVFSLTWGPH